MKTLISLAFVIAFVAISTCDPHRRTQRQEEVPPKSDDPTEEEIAIFKEWKEKFGKEYSSEEEESEAMKKVLTNYGLIKEHNRKFDDGEVGFTRALFVHSDMSSQEKRKFLTGVAVPPSEKVEHTPRSLPALPQFPKGPNYVNWVEKGLVGSVVDQGEFSKSHKFTINRTIFQKLRLVQLMLGI
jgi:Cathepsin propeptide inhibitor domain (I29)